MEVRREVYSGIIKVVSCLYTIIRGIIVYSFDYRFFYSLGIYYMEGIEQKLLNSLISVLQ